MSDHPPGQPRVRIGAILIVQAIAGAALFVAAPTDSEWSAVVALSALGFFALGHAGVYYLPTATLVTTDEMGGATNGGQRALVVGSVLAPPAFGFLADAVGHRSPRWPLAAGTVVASGLLAYSVRFEPPADDLVMGGDGDRAP